MSECTNGEMRDLLPELVNGRLDAETQAMVEAHVASCTECAEEVALLRSLRPALMSGPPIDIQGVAAAVRARTAGAASGGLAHGGVAARWRLAVAAAAIIAASALGYMVRTHRAPGAPEVAVVRTPPSESIASNPVVTAPATAHAPIVAPPRSAPVQTPPRQVAIASPHDATQAAPPTTVASSGALDNLSDLSDDDVRMLTASLDTLSPVPDADPAPGIDPLGASLEDLSAGGS